MQILHFRQKIESDPELELVEIYQDEGVSGTSTLKRLGFQRMINDAKEGKIDLILTKSINRFGRNIVDILKADRQAHQPRLNPRLRLRLRRELRVGGRGGMDY